MPQTWWRLHRSLSDIGHSTAANDAQASASFAASHLPAPHSPRDERHAGQAPRHRSFRNIMPATCVVCIIAAITLTLAGWESSALAVKAVKEVSDGIAAIVNNEVITLSELDSELHDEIIRLRARYRGTELERQLAEKRYEVLNNLIDQRILVQEAKAKGIQVSEEELKEAKERLAANPLAQGTAASASEKQLRQDIMVQKLMSFEVFRLVMVSPEEIRAYYDEHTSQFTDPPRYHIRQILVKPRASETVAGARKEAEGIYAKLKNGDSFADLARRHSDGPEGQVGGDLGFLAKQECLAPIARALETMSVGETSPPIETSLGVHIILLEEKIPGETRPLEAVENQIRSLLMDRKTREVHQAWLKNLKKKAYIEVKL